MSGGQTKLAEHPVLVVIGVIAAIIGALAAGKDLFSSEDPPPKASASAPASARPASPPDSGDDGAPASPSPTLPRSVGAGPGTPPEASAPEDPAPQGRAPLPDGVGSSAKPEPPGHTGPLIVRIDMGTSGKVGPTTWRARSTPGANTVVQDAGGRLDRGCYVQWTVKRGGEVVRMARSERCRPPGITLFSFEDSLDEVGSYTLTADITTDWGQTASKTTAFEAVPR
ncbi:hypothetical protein [Streptomyces sp. cmx-4-9]|uniref:hypothetical protein n=1 Tax=Streptomyces sp. cmx-4-9 TaxID=2790941 RepID=UPI00397EDDBE